MDNLEHWNALCRPPECALKQIKGGRLKGMTDINPQWRLKAITEHFGPVGIGWSYEIVRTWCEGAANEVCAFAEIKLSIKHDGEWSKPIPGIGGSKLLTQETHGGHVSDECYKMAVTDALSVAMKAVGVAADIYAGCFDGSKYTTPPPASQQATQPAEPTVDQEQAAQPAAPPVDQELLKKARELFNQACNILDEEQKAWCTSIIEQFPQDAREVIDYLNKL